MTSLKQAQVPSNMIDNNFLISLIRHDTRTTWERSWRKRLPLRRVAWQDGKRHPEPFLHRSGPIQRELVRYQCPVGERCCWPGDLFVGNYEVINRKKKKRDRIKIVIFLFSCRGNIAFWMFLETQSSAFKWPDCGPSLYSFVLNLWSGWCES